MGIMATPHKHPRTGVYYFRMSVPKKLRDIIGKTEFKTSLETKVLSEAKRLYPTHLENAHKQIELAELKLSDVSNLELSLRDCMILAERWYERVRDELDLKGNYSDFLRYERYLTQDNQERFHIFGLSDTFSIVGRDATKATEEEFEELSDGLEEYIVDQLDREGLVVRRNSDSFKRLVAAFYDYVYRLEALCKARHKRDFGFDPITNPIADKPLSSGTVTLKQAPKAVSVKATQNSISSLFERYLKSEKLKDKDLKSLDEAGLQIRRLIEVIGDISVTEVSKAHIIEFRDTLCQLPKSKLKEIRSKSLSEQIELATAQDLSKIATTTVKNCLRKTSSVFGFAVELGLIDTNPHRGVSVTTNQKKTEVEQGRGYSSDEVDMLFKADVFNQVDIHKPYGMACYWIPILCRYTGARLEEIAQLRKSDIAVSDEGIHYINVRRGEGQSVKNNNSLRHVPLHHHIIELGFVDFVQSCTEFLFPELKTNKHGKRASALSKWWRQQVTLVGVVTKQPFHSFRHSLKTSLRSLDVQDTVSDAITGHSPSNVGAAYGTVDLVTKQKAIERLPMLALKRIW